MTRITDDTKVFVDHNVYILGAGFSADAGLPVLNNFLEQMRASMNWIREQNRDREFAAIRKVFKFRKEASSAAVRVDLNLENIEDLFSLATASGQYPLEQSVSTAIAGTLDFSRRTGTSQCFEIVVDNDLAKPSSWMAKTKENGAARYIIPPYDLYAGVLSGRICTPGKFMKNTIISFNYDTVLEEALGNWKEPFWYGFKPRSVEYDGSNKWARENPDDAIPLLKLHGSVNWAKPKGPRGRLNVFDTYSDVLKADGRVVLIPPTWRKSFQGPLSEVWNAAIRALSEATRVIIIGFSVPPTDVHFRYLLAAGLQENISLGSIFCFNPCPQVEENLFKILRPELRERGFASFHRNCTRDLCIGRTRDYQPLSALFNRRFSKSVSDPTLGPEIKMDLNAQG